MSHSKPAIEFQASLKAGDRFTPIEDYAAHTDHVLTVVSLKEAYADPGDCTYNVLRDDGMTPWVRCRWLRKCCRRVDSVKLTIDKDTSLY